MVSLELLVPCVFSRGWMSREAPSLILTMFTEQVWSYIAITVCPVWMGRRPLTGSGPQCVRRLRRTAPATWPVSAPAAGWSAWTAGCRGTPASPGTGNAAPGGSRPVAAAARGKKGEWGCETLASTVNINECHLPHQHEHCHFWHQHHNYTHH